MYQTAGRLSWLREAITGEAELVGSTYRTMRDRVVELS